MGPMILAQLLAPALIGVASYMAGRWSKARESRQQERARRAAVEGPEMIEARKWAHEIATKEFPELVR